MAECTFCDREKDIDEREFLWTKLDMEPLGSIDFGCYLEPEGDDFRPLNVMNEYDHDGPRLMFTVSFHDSREMDFTKRIKYCPMCGRKLEAE